MVGLTLARRHEVCVLDQRMFNPPHPPKPDWGETLRGVGLFAALVAAGWYLAGAPVVDGYRLGWLREGFDAYGTGVLIVAGTILIWSLLAAAYASRHPWNRVLLDVPLNAAWWLLHQGALVLGASVLAIVTGLGVGAFGA